MTTWYDRPQYFDMVFRDETADEVRFFEAAFEQFANIPVRRLYEPGCGSGRLVAELAAKRYDVVAIDNNDAMLAYLSNRLRRRGLTAHLENADMTSFVCKERVDAAFCTFNTFRHLLDEKSVLAHFYSVAQSLRPGGLYILGFHCIPLDADEDCTERWTAKHGGTKISVTLKVVDFNRRKRQERLRVSIKATKASGKVERIRNEFPLRLYTPKQAHNLLGKVSDVFELVEAFDFDYDINSPRDLDDDLTDALFVLRRV